MAIHLSIVGQDPVSEGHHRWTPGSDSSYAVWQAGDMPYDDGGVGWSEDMHIPQ